MSDRLRLQSIMVAEKDQLCAGSMVQLEGGGCIKLQYIRMSTAVVITA